MQTDELIRTLGFADSPRFLREDAVARVPPHAHVLRRAFRDCGVRGVYFLADDLDTSAVPALYVAEAADASQADEIHRKVWNQNVVPFLLVRTPTDLRLFSGFRYRPADGVTAPEQRGVLEVSVAFEEVLDRLRDLHASCIDDGTIWRAREQQIDPSSRVDWRLLENLKALGEWLRAGTNLEPRVTHALIGKFVYLRYLRDRDILSDRKLQALGINLDQAFGRHATLGGVQALIEKVDGWLNGSIFPFPFSGRKAPKAEHIQRVAGVFLGDDPVSGQLHLDFDAYDFSFIPIETLSVIYEQFLSAEVKSHEQGAYYTPIHLVNFMLSELDDMRRLEPGATVLDPACGSGAFLVQCYRWIVERHLARGGKLRPSELRELLVTSIFGVDRDEDACQITSLSLLLAMLDYLDPPDLQNTPQFQLPNLIGHNVFVADFFDEASSWASQSHTRLYDLVVGNPPWIQAGQTGQHVNSHARVWMDEHAATHPVTNNEVAEAFAWKVMDHVEPNGAVALLLPAMTLFKDSPAFRSRYFTETDVAAVANFTNLRELLFGGKARLPAAAFFVWGSRDAERDAVTVFSPLVANQETNRTRPGNRKEPWVITADSSEIQQVSRAAIRDGDMLPWKIAMWGGPRDMHLLRSMREFPTLDAFGKMHGLALAEGLQLREKAHATEAIVEVPEVAGQLLLNVKALKSEGRIYVFPPDCLTRVSPTSAYARTRGGVQKPLSVCRPPHVIVSGARTFATFSSEFIVVPPRQIGIGGRVGQALLLKALALYLNSDFVAYVEAFTSPQAGVREGRSTLAALKGIPIPFDSLSSGDIASWAKLYDELAVAQQKLWQARARGDTPRRLVDPAPFEARIAELEARAGTAVGDALRLTDEERVLVRDLVVVRRRLADGLVPDDVVRTPSDSEFEAYASRLERTLDSAIDDGQPRRHDVRIVNGSGSGMVRVELVPSGRRIAKSRAVGATGTVAAAFARIRRRMQQERGQWLYFDRNLFLFEDECTYILKPLQRLWWTESQALADADHLVAEALNASKGGVR